MGPSAPNPRRTSESGVLAAGPTSGHVSSSVDGDAGLRILQVILVDQVLHGRDVALGGAERLDCHLDGLDARVTGRYLSLALELGDTEDDDRGEDAQDDDDDQELDQREAAVTVLAGFAETL